MSGTGRPGREGGRFRWLDVARAVAVAAVALMHLSDQVWPGFRHFGRQVVNPGVFGVQLFFLISGFVIPFTLERRGSLRAFVIARLFRLYPLYWLSLAVLLGLHAIEIAELPPDFSEQWPASVLWNVTMFQSWLGYADAMGLYWTLGYELGFYTAVVALFLLGLHKRTEWVVLAGIAYVASRGVIWPLLGQGVHYDPSDVWKVTFFVGTLWYRASTRTLTVPRAAALTLALAASAVGSFVITYVVRGYSTRPPAHINPEAWIYPNASLAGTGLAYAVFLALYFTHFGEASKVLNWIGRISYSIYLLHGLVLLVPLPFSPELTFVARLVMVLALSTLTFRYLETPAIGWGRAVAARVDFSPAAIHASVGPVTVSSGSESSAPRTSSADVEPRQKERAASEGRLDPRRAAVAVMLALGTGGAIGYFGRPPQALDAKFSNFDPESTSKGMLAQGWSGFEKMPSGDTFVWCIAKSCTLRVRAAQESHLIRVRMFPYLFPGAPTQTVKVFVNETAVGGGALAAAPTVLTFTAPSPVWRSGRNDVRFEFGYAEVPKLRAPGAEDQRSLAAAFDWIDILPSPR